MHDLLQPRISSPIFGFFFGQLDLFILQWEEVPGSGFDLTVLDTSDRKRTDTYVSLPLRIKRWDLYLPP